MIDSVASVLGLVSAGIFIAHAIESYRAHAFVGAEARFTSFKTRHVPTCSVNVCERRKASVCRDAGSSRKAQMNVIIQKLNGLWHLIVGSCRIRTPFLETQDREWVVAYARRIYPGAKIFERD